MAQRQACLAAHLEHIHKFPVVVPLGIPVVEHDRVDLRDSMPHEHLRSVQPDVSVVLIHRQEPLELVLQGPFQFVNVQHKGMYRHVKCSSAAFSARLARPIGLRRLCG